MKEENKHSVSEELLYRHFSGEASQGEEKAITAWVAESDVNQVEYNRIHTFFLDTKAINSIDKSSHSYDTEKAWQNVKQKNKLKTNDSGVQTKTSGAFLRIAASIIIATGLGWFTYNSLYSVEEVVLATTVNNVSRQLVDGSEITLNKNSKLIYPDKFTGNKREVELSGEAYFDITPDTQKPFIIKSNDLSVKVLGTTFNVDASNKDSIVVVVDTGIVLLTAGEKQEKLEAGTVGIYDKQAQTLSKIIPDNTSTQTYWKTKLLIFKGNTLTDVVKSIQNVYETKISIDTPGLGDCRISVTFEDESLDNVLEIITATLRLELTKLDDSYSLKGDVCNN